MQNAKAPIDSGEGQLPETMKLASLMLQTVQQSVLWLASVQSTSLYITNLMPALFSVAEVPLLILYGSQTGNAQVRSLHILSG